MKIKFENWRAEHWSAVAAGFSAIAAIFAIGIAASEKDTPYQQSLYEERWQAYNDFARASNRFPSVLADSSSAISLYIDSERGLAMMSQAGL